MNHKSKNLAIISFHTSPLSRLGVIDAGGMNVYILSLAKALVQLGWSVDVFTRKQAKNDPTITTVTDNFRVISLSVNDRYDIPKKQLHSYTQEFAQQIYTFIDDNYSATDLDGYQESGEGYIEHAIGSRLCSNNNPYDLIHAHYYLSGLVGIQLKEKFNIPLVSTFHTLGYVKQKYGETDETMRITDEREVAKKSDAIIVSTEFESKILQTEYNIDRKAIVIIPPGVDSTIFKPHNKKISREVIDFPFERKLVVFVGRIDPIKGISMLIKALRDLTREHPDFHHKVSVFLIGGDIENEDFWDIPEVQHIQDLIARYGLECCVTFLGAKKHHELATYYSAADVVVMPSFYESFSLVTLEAMATGAAVLGSRVGGLKFLIDDEQTGRLFENKNTDELCQTLFTLLEDEDERVRLGTNAHIFSQDFSWEKQAEKVARVYESLIHS